MSKAAEINYPDMLVISGQYQIKPPLPFVPGKAAAGIVSAVGAGVTDLKVGDRVAAQVEYGAFAQKLLAAAVNVFPMPAAIDFTKGAALGLVYQTAHFALVERARLQTGDDGAGARRLGRHRRCQRAGGQGARRPHGDRRRARRRQRRGCTRRPAPTR